MTSFSFVHSTAILLFLLPALYFQSNDHGRPQLHFHQGSTAAQGLSHELCHSHSHKWTNCTRSLWRDRAIRRRNHHGQRNSMMDIDGFMSDQALRIIGPYFESNRTTKTIKARAGHDVLLDCAVVLLQGRTVSWLRRKSSSVQLLTVGNQTYSSDSRLGLHFRYPNNWRLGILKVSQEDEGEYQCQLSTHPPKALVFHLRVIAPAVQILDDNENVIAERHYKVDSSLHLTCRASNLEKPIEQQLTWLKGDFVLPGNDSRIKVKYSKNPMTGETNAFLSLHSVRKEDSGNYSCIASPQDKGTIVVHVLNEKHPEAVHYENSVQSRSQSPSSLICFSWSFLLVLIVHHNFGSAAQTESE